MLQDSKMVRYCNWHVKKVRGSIVSLKRFELDMNGFSISDKECVRDE